MGATKVQWWIKEPRIRNLEGEGAMASDGKEERRRRIVESGSDRMALITGQIQSLDSSSSQASSTTSSYSHLAHDNPSSPSTTVSQHAQIDAGSGGADYESGSKFLKRKASNEASEGINFDNRNLEQHLQERVTPTEAYNKMTEVQTSIVTPSIRKASDKPNFFSSKRINSCIIASQRSRVICSLIIASLVLISYIDYPLLGINIVSSESIIASRPLYMVLLTDVTIVLVRLFRERGNHGTEESERERMVSKEDGDNWVGAVKLLERGLAVYQAIRGIFIDCSVYLVVVICALSLL
ncbi:hypothetical protein POTOM_013338 [Populus tomentosa]|uniref:Uncharacterized protein n=1 Tax=Populus tomentosa TaxID=118781 RepID=A0A8X8A059_POPTO|nr:hypothetical protein POTOM_013338 [Populus tomentosa]